MHKVVVSLASSSRKDDLFTVLEHTREVEPPKPKEAVLDDRVTSVLFIRGVIG